LQKDSLSIIGWHVARLSINATIWRINVAWDIDEVQR
jgi:hypothetical protein